jgi:aspartyl protease family protein
MNNPLDQQTKNHSRKMGFTMFVLAWLVLIGLLVLFFSGQLNKQYNPNQNPSQQLINGENKEVILQPNKQHHYVVSGTINNSSVVFLLDTGATDVVIPFDIARQLKLNLGQKQYANTANGTVAVYSTVINEITIGNIELHNVKASINPSMKDEVILLGMSALRQIEFSQRGDTLILRQ